MSFTNRRGADFEDLTARARIRDAALEYFAECGFDRATIREIARAAGVSPGLVRHHFGSKDELRKACDAYTLKAVRAYVDQAMDEGLDNPKLAGPARDALLPFRRYLARALIDGSPDAGRIFDEMVTMAEQSLRLADAERPDRPAADLRTRATLTVAMALGIPAFRAHVGRSIGADIYSAEGDRRIALALLDIYSHPILSEETARTLGEGLTKPGS